MVRAILCALMAVSVCQAQGVLPIDTKMAWGVERLGENLFVVDCNSTRLLRLDSDGAVAATLNTAREGAPSSPRGLCALGDLLAYADGGSLRIVFVDPNRMTVVREIPAPGPAPQGLAFDGVALWCADGEQDRLYRLDPDTGEVLAQLPAPAFSPRGLDFSDGKLWVLDSWDVCAYRIDPASGHIEASVTVPTGRPRGIIAGEGSLTLTLATANLLLEMPFREENGYTLSLPIDAEVSTVCDVKCRGEEAAPSGAHAVAALPMNTPRQSVENLRFSPEPTRRYHDDYGQEVAEWAVPPLQPGEVFPCSWTADVRTMAMRFSPLPREGAGATPVSEAYLRSDRFISADSPAVRELTVGLDTLTPLPALLALRNRIFERMTYELAGGWSRPETCLETGKGSCSEYSFIFAAAARSMGIPTRLVGGTVLRAPQDKEHPTLERVDIPSHRWTEVYLPDHGWVPIDANRDDNSKGPPFRRRTFLSLRSGVLVMCRGPMGEGVAMNLNYRVRLRRPRGQNFWTREAKSIWRLEKLSPWTG